MKSLWNGVKRHGASALAGLLLVVLASASYAQITFRSASPAAINISGQYPSFVLPGVVASAASGNVTPTLPSSWQPGDLWICVIESRDNVAATMPSGWSLLNEGSGPGGQHQATLFWKRAAIGDTDPAVTHSGGGRIAAMIFGLRGVDMTTPFDTVNSFTLASPASTTTSAGSITSTNATTTLLFIAHVGAPDAFGSAPEGFSFVSGGSSGSSGEGVAIGVWKGAQLTAGSKPAVQVTHPSSVESHGAQIAVRPGATLTIAKPAGTVTNDVMVASIAALHFNPSDAILAPSGWTLVRRLDGSPGSLSVYVKTAGSSEPAQYTWTVLATTGVSGGIQTFAGVDTANPVDVETGQNTASGLAHSTPSAVTTVANAMLVSSHAYSSAGTWTPPGGMTEGFDVVSLVPPAPAGITVEGSYALQATAGATGQKTATASGNADIGNAHILALRPATAAAGAQLYFVHTDHLNTPRLITNQVGQAVWRWDNTDPFGGNVPDENPSGLGTFTCNLRFTGTYADKETGLLYNWHRNLDPARGQYLEAEPLGLAGDINLYRYARNNPLTYFDPDGRQATAATGVAGGSAGSRAAGSPSGSSSSGSFARCYQKCIDERLVDPATYAFNLLALGAAYGIGATPFYGGVISAAELGGAYAGGYVGAYFGGAAGAKAGVTAGIAAGGGILAGVGIVGAGLAGYAIGSAGYCAARCGTDPCYYQ